MSSKLRLGIDVGSTTIKLVFLNHNDECIYSKYQRHLSDIKTTLTRMLEASLEEIGDASISIVCTGSGAMQIAEDLQLKFEQEVIACTKAVEKYIENVDVAIELGGEDSKITYFDNTLEQRMNSSCAGGTGAFIDQMATLLETDAKGLNELAKSHKIIYPIAARCGVFAKTDVQPLINEGVAKEDISASIFQAVVNQTISVLACGRPITGKVAFLGGPLYFLTQLKERFIDTLNLEENDIIVPDNPQLFVALGAALISDDKKSSLKGIIEQLNKLSTTSKVTSNIVPLFEGDKDYQQFCIRHNSNIVARNELATYEGEIYLGIDAGSTTTKLVLVGEDNELLYEYYGNNNGDPLTKVMNQLLEIYNILPQNVHIASSCVTGYGEALIQNTFKIAYGEVETIAHYRGAKEFAPQVGFILDIGGQDMKCIRIKDDIVQSVVLNEACSSGCGSFVEMLSESLNISVEEFSEKALFAKYPVDLGTRCTVFMNSKVKEAQKEGANIGDISSGLAYAVIKNALYKVIKLRDAEGIKGDVVVQGGTFYNKAILRAMEKTLGKEVIRPDIAGLMGAYGAALLAKERKNESSNSILSREEILELKINKTPTRCSGCENQCLLTINRLSDGRKYIYGNKCEKPLGKMAEENQIPNLFNYKYQRVFDYESLNNKEATRGEIGIPRVLNMYENYPFWHTFFSDLSFSVKLSSRSSKNIYEKGITTIPSESVCYPGKLVHGHMADLIEGGTKVIFYPQIPYERREDKKADNHYNCPIVSSYPEVIKHNMDIIDENKVKFIIPFINLDSRDGVIKQLYNALLDFDISKKEIKKAVDSAYIALDKFKLDIKQKGEEVLEWIRTNKSKGIVVGGRPYHLDPEINHGLTKLITEEGFAVLTEDSVAHLSQINHPLRVLDQWTYHNRLYRAAKFVTTTKDLEMIQLTSFGCGLDAVTAEQVQEILEEKGKIHTLIKIDEGSNLGAIKIRIRSLKAAIFQREKNADSSKIKEDIQNSKTKPLFTQEMKSKHTILFPQMSPVHFQFLEPAFNSSGYRVKVLKEVCEKDIDEGLKYVNNDACYPAIVVIGQMIRALKSPDIDINNTSLIITQTGGGCRASNYIGFLRKALADSGMGNIPVISLSAQKIETHPGFKLNIGIINKVIMSMLYGDLLSQVLYRTRPYEKAYGSANKLYNKWCELAKENILNGSFSTFKKYVKEIVKQFDELPLLEVKKPKIGLVGEILVKYHPYANNYAIETIEKEGGEAVVPGILDFFYYCVYNNKFKYYELSKSLKGFIGGETIIKYLNYKRECVVSELGKSNRFTAPHSIEHLGEITTKIMPLGHQMGEGWFLTGEILGLMEDEINNVVCMQPFGCLPNHVTGKGMVKAIRKLNPLANIACIDYDPGASKVNQLNRIKLMMATSKKNL